MKISNSPNTKLATIHLSCQVTRMIFVDSLYVSVKSRTYSTAPKDGL